MQTPFRFDSALSDVDRLRLAGRAVSARLLARSPEWGRRLSGPVVRLLYNPGADEAWSLTVWDEADAEIERRGVDERDLMDWGFGPLVERCRRNPWRAQTLTGLVGTNPDTATPAT